MSFKRFFLALICCLCLSQQLVKAQDTPSVLEGYLQSISSSGQLRFRITTVRTGDMSSGLITAWLPADKWDLYIGLRRFHSQKWLITLIKAGQAERYELRSAYGLGVDHSKIDLALPTPLRNEVTNEPIYDHSRATFGAYEQEVVELTNQERWSNGYLPPYKQVDLLHNAADGHSEAMAEDDFFAHCNLVTGSSPGQRMTAAGYNHDSAAENIAAGYSTPAAVLAGWMSSSGHRTNILSTSRREIGVGYEYRSDSNSDDFDDDSNCQADNSGGPYYRYWTQNFGLRNFEYPLVIERELAETNLQSVDLFIYGPGNATSMRFSNDGVIWSDWFDYTPDYTWQLSPYSGLKTVYSQVSTEADGAGLVYDASDEILLSVDCDPMVFSNTTLNGSQTYLSCEIIADPNVSIDGQIIFEAGSVTLGLNVEVPDGSTFEVQIP